MRAARWLPWGIWALLVLLVTARWTWIGGTGDFATHYDWAERILAGDIPGRDYVTTLVPGSAYLLAAFLALVGDAVIWHQVFLHLAWGAALAVGLALALRAAGADPGRRLAAAAGTLLAVPLSFPLSTLAVPHNDIVTALLGAALLLFLGEGAGRTGWRSLGAGLLIGLAAWTKQNVGLAFAGGFLALLLLGRLCLPQLYGSLRPLLLCTAGWLLGLALPALYFVQHAPPAYLLDLYGPSAASGKGGAVVLLRPLPRLVLETLPPETPRRLLELALSAALFLPLALLVWRRSGRAERAAAPGGGGPLLLAMLVVAAFWLIALMPWAPARALGAWLAAAVGQNSLQAFLLTLAYGLGSVTGAVLFLRLAWQARRQPAPPTELGGTLLLLGGVLLIAAGQATSSLYYTHSSILVLAPVLAVLAWRYLRLPRLALPAAAVTVAVLGCLSPQFQPSFEPLEWLPADSPFAGLAAPPSRAATLSRDWELLPPLLRDRRVLWLAPYGPHPAFGGRQVPSIAGLYISTHGRRHEEEFLRRWQADPPEVVVQKPFAAIRDSYWVEDARLERWLAASYTAVVRLPDLTVWVRR